MSDETESDFDRGFAAGEASAVRGVFQECLKRLNPKESDEHAWLLERSAAISALRDLSAELEITADWPDDLHLADIINEHIIPALSD